MVEPTPNVTIGALQLAGTDAYGVTWTVSRARFSGWGGGSATAPSKQRLRSDGAIGGTSFREPLHVEVGGTIQAPSEAAAWAAQDRLNVACSISGTVVSVAEEGRTRWTTARREDAVLFSPRTTKLWIYSLQMEVLDPRLFGETLSADTGLASSSGGVTYPHTYPYSFNSTVVAGHVSLFNSGDTAGPVVVRFDGPVTGPIVTHKHEGSTVETTFAINPVQAIPAGNWLTVMMDPAVRSVMENDQAPRNRWVTSRGFCQFEPGWNTFYFSAAAYSATAKMTVTAIEAW